MTQSIRRSGMSWIVLVGWLAIASLAARPAAAQCVPASPIACGETQAGALSVIGEVDCFTFTAAANETVSITAQETAGFFQACWLLFTPSMEPLGAVCGGQAQRTLAVGGTYTIQVFDNNGDQSGAYDLNLVFVSDTASNCAEPIACGETPNRIMGLVAESDTFRFAGTAGDAVSITAQETAGGVAVCWELYDPTGQSLTGACGQDQRTLAVSGGYTIRVHDNGDTHTGTYDLNLVVVSDTAASCAESIACGQTLARPIDTIAESDTFRFTSGAAETVSISVQETGGGVAACWELYDPQGIAIANACGQGERKLAFAGDYTIRVFDSGDLETGTYDLTLVFVSDTPSNCAESVTCGQLLARDIEQVAVNDTFRFVAAAGETVSVTTQETSAFINACWEIYDPEGISLGGTCGQTEKTLAVAGGYTIRVSDSGDVETGTYNLNLVVVSETAHNCSLPIACGNTLERDLPMVGLSETFRFTAAAGETVSVTSQETSAFINACWEIYDPEGISLGGACGQIEKTLPVAGDYTVRVSDNGDLQTGTYNLNLVVLSETAHNCGTPIGCGEVLTGEVNPRGESDSYRFTGIGGQPFRIETAETAGSLLNACWELYDPTGASLGDACGADDNLLAFTGEYTIRVHDSGDDSTGPYSVILCTPTSTTTTTTLTPGSTTSSTTLPGGGELVSGDSLVMKDNPAKTRKRKLSLRSTDGSLGLGGGPGSANDPTQAGGSLRFLSAAGDTFDVLYALPASQWKPITARDPSRGWKFGKGSAIKRIVIMPGLLKIVGKGAALAYTLGANPDPVDVVLTLGGRPYCLRFGGTVSFAPGKKFDARNAPRPIACPAFAGH